MESRYRILKKIYGDIFNECYYIDSYLDCFKDGEIRSPPDNFDVDVKKIGDRALRYSLEKGYLETYSDNRYRITATGLIHLSKGGETSVFVKHKLNNYAIVLSIIATVISIISFFIVINS